MKYLVVGAGFAGATVARELAEAGHQVVVIDKRDHIAGNAFDSINEYGIRTHEYGPHLWHTSNTEVHEWASKFTEWVPYQHSVQAQLADGSYVPLPINRKTIEAVFPQQFSSFCAAHDLIQYDEAEYEVGYVDGAHAKFLESKVEHHAEVTNSRQHVENSVGKELCDLFFEPYTKKMWGLSLEELPASVAARIPTNVESGSDLYFPKDTYQCLPADGYTEMVRRILDHDNIHVRLNTPRDWVQNPNMSVYWQMQFSLNDLDFDHIFTSEPIDTYFGCSLGELPWRSVKMRTSSFALPSALPSAVVNFTGTGPFTRVTEWKKLPAHGDNPDWTTITVEEPCDYRDNLMERYYPVKTSLQDCPHRELYRRYRELADKEKGVTFIGRCGQYAYLDMHMAISSSLHEVRRYLKSLDSAV